MGGGILFGYRNLILERLFPPHKQDASRFSYWYYSKGSRYKQTFKLLITDPHVRQQFNRGLSVRLANMEAPCSMPWAR